MSLSLNKYKSNSTFLLNDPENISMIVRKINQLPRIEGLSYHNMKQIYSLF